MRRLLTGLCFLLLPLGCGRHPTPGGQLAASGSGSTTSSGGAAGIDGGSSNAGGSSSQAGQAAGTAGTAVAPAGGSAAQGGSGGTTGGNNAGSNTSGGDSGTGGTSSVAGAGGDATVDPRFTLSWRDDFNDFDDNAQRRRTTAHERLAHGQRRDFVRRPVRRERGAVRSAVRLGRSLHVPAVALAPPPTFAPH